MANEPNYRMVSGKFMDRATGELKKPGDPVYLTPNQALKFSDMVEPVEAKARRAAIQDAVREAENANPVSDMPKEEKKEPGFIGKMMGKKAGDEEPAEKDESPDDKDKDKEPSSSDDTTDSLGAAGGSDSGGEGSSNK